MEHTDDSQAVQLGSDELASTDKPAGIVKCNCDQNLEASFYCEDHKEVICLTCKTLRHKNCKQVTLKEKSTGYDKTKLNSLLEGVKALKGINENFMQERTANLEQLTDTKQNCIEKMHKFRKELNSLLDDLENNTLTLLDQEETKQKQPIADQISASEIIGEMLQTDIDHLQDVMKSEETQTLFAADVKISDRVDHYCSSLGDMFSMPVFPMLNFKANEQLLGTLKSMCNTATFEAMSSDLKSIVTDAENSYSQDSKSRKEISKSFINRTFRMLLQPNLSVHGDGKTLDISGCDFMPNGELVLCDYKNHSVMVLNKCLSFKESLTIKSSPYPYDVSSVSDKKAVVTLSSVKRLQFIEIKPSLKTANEIQLDKKCWGVNVVDDEIYVTCSDMNRLGRNTGEVRVLKLDGTLVRKLGLNEDGSFLFSRPYALAVNATSGNVFVTDQYDGTVTCLNSLDGTIVSQVKDSHLAGVRGVFVDDEDNVMVCGKDSNALLMITARGKLHVSVLTAIDGVKSPLSVVYRSSDNIFIVGCENSKYLITMVMA